MRSVIILTLCLGMAMSLSGAAIRTTTRIAQGPAAVPGPAQRNTLLVTLLVIKELRCGILLNYPICLAQRSAYMGRGFCSRLRRVIEKATNIVVVCSTKHIR
ncbi:hypothetical protein BGW36DRAFT_391839 [Talaromyces proteolyticus]|uniref:Secreted protein n=1 Tax=Talaromyces proteolyticus TaxID=1131652 RepID=A0AAD4KFL6_9EURO|nr:uncharacterized protein BGW36DRAFT_391839 [Talaromyces proteolyticus]KAH8689144.1 hypothetical protein BGW36DRAFT_391839 [Talaromyces proteolyticus]